MINSRLVRRAVVIAGPTASGKSGLALKIAKSLNGVIINADSQQLYSSFRVLTSRPTSQDEVDAEHRLYGCLRPNEISSLKRWADIASREVHSALDAGALPIIVGGTGLYIKSLIGGFSDIPDVPDQVRLQANDIIETKGLPYLYSLLARKDPGYGKKINPNDAQRISRAWEVIEYTGFSLDYWHSRPHIKLLNGVDVLSLAIFPLRAELYKACDQRFFRMLELGALKEVEQILASGIDINAPVMRALGAKELAQFIHGCMDLDTATKAAQQRTRRYAKRQVTWFKNQFNASEVINKQLSESFIGKIIRKIDQFRLT